MIKKVLENTYCYEDFITKEQQDILYKWAFDSFPYMDFANPCNREEDQQNLPVRHFGMVQNLGYIPELFWELKNKIIELEGIEEVLEAPGNGDWVGITGIESRVEPHTDWNGHDPNYYTRRCDAGLVEHSSIPNKGNRLRVNISFGFSIPVGK
jgi:hypothetical protein